MFLCFFFFTEKTSIFNCFFTYPVAFKHLSYAYSRIAYLCRRDHCPVHTLVPRSNRTVNLVAVKYGCIYVLT